METALKKSTDAKVMEISVLSRFTSDIRHDPGTRIRVVLPCLVLAALGTVSPAPALAANRSIQVVDNDFTPSLVGVKPGESVTWTSSGANPHNVHFEDGGLIAPLPPIPGPWTTSRTFAAAGAYRYYCDIHGAPGGQGMSGIVFVNATGNVSPTASFTTSPNRAQVGAPVSFNASGSRDPDGSIAQYEWDLDGDGSFETNTGTTPSASRSYTSAGTVTVKLRVTDSGGDTAEATRSLEVTSLPVVGPPLQGGSATGGSAGGSTGGSTGSAAPGNAPPPPPSFAASKRTIAVSKSGRFSYSFTARPGLTGTVALRSSKKVRVSLRRRISLGTKQFTVPASGIVKVSWRLSRKNLRILRRSGRIGFKATVTLRSATGATRSGTAALTLK